MFLLTISVLLCTFILLEAPIGQEFVPQLRHQNREESCDLAEQALISVMEEPASPLM